MVSVGRKRDPENSLKFYRYEGRIAAFFVASGSFDVPKMRPTSRKNIKNDGVRASICTARFFITFGARTILADAHGQGRSSQCTKQGSIVERTELLNSYKDKSVGAVRRFWWHIGTYGIGRWTTLMTLI